VRVRVQRVADRRLFGDRSDPLAVLASVSGAGENAESPFEALVNAVAATLRLHYVALDLVEPDGLRRVAVHGTERGAPVVRIPLTWHGSDLGALLVAARSTRDPLRSTELALLAAVADQAAATVETRHLAETLQRSREQIVQAAEEERRRLRRDLHDGLGARLAAIGYELEAAARRPADASAQDVVRQAQSDLVNAVTELRRVIDDLRPGPLDDLGLAEALAGTARWLLEEAGVSAEISSTLPPALPLSAGTEIALFRIGVEAVANVVRHAHAMTCRVHLCLDGRVVVLRVCDDGRGPAKTHGELTNGYHRVGGLGIASMRDRAAELGGTLTIATGPVLGTTVEARVPIGLLQ
jgi:signal transduction histidine kinase